MKHRVLDKKKCLIKLCRPLGSLYRVVRIFHVLRFLERCAKVPGRFQTIHFLFKYSGGFRLFLCRLHYSSNKKPLNIDYKNMILQPHCMDP